PSVKAKARIKRVGAQFGAQSRYMVASAMSVDAHEAAKHYCTIIVSRECVDELLEGSAVPAAWREPTRFDALVTRLATGRRAPAARALHRCRDRGARALL